MTEEQFNSVAYSYRSWPAHDPKGVSEQYEELWTLFRQQQAEIEELKAYQKHDIELSEAIGWEKGYEAGRQLGMKQERALWELAASTQEIEKK